MDFRYILIWTCFSIIVGFLYYCFIFGPFRAGAAQKLAELLDHSKTALTGVGPTPWALLSLALAALAQLTLTLALHQPWQPHDSLAFLPGFLLYALAGIAFMRGLQLLRDSPPGLAATQTDRAGNRLALWFRISALACGIPLFYHTAHTLDPDPAGYAFVALWVFCIGLFVAGVLIDGVWSPASPRSIQQWLEKNRCELLVVAAIVAFALFVRLVDLELHPFAFTNDEGEVGKNALAILRGAITNLFTAGWAGQPQVSFLPAAASVALFGRTAFAVRLVSAITGSLATLATYLFAREVFNKKVAWVAALLLATLPVQVHFSRMGVGNVVDFLTAPLILFLLFRGLKSASRGYFVAAGLVAGLCFYTYAGSLLALGLGIGALSYAALQMRGFFRAHAGNLLLFAQITLIVALPILGYYSAHPEYLLARAKSQNILTTGVLQQLATNAGESPAGIVTDQFLRSSLVFILTPASSNFYGSPKPYLTPLAALFFMLGLIYTFWHGRNPFFLTLLVWFWAPIILGSTLTTNPPSNQRMLMSMPALVIITAIGLTKAIEAISSSSRVVSRFGPLLVLVVVLCIGYQDVNFYFYEYRAGHFFEDWGNEFSFRASNDAAALHDQGRLDLIGDPGTPYLYFADFDYFAPDVAKNYFTTVTRQSVSALPHDKDILFIATPPRLADLELIRQWIPGGEWEAVKRLYLPAQTLYYRYKLSKDLLEKQQPH